MLRPTIAERRRQAVCLFAGLVGAMVAARAVNDAALSRELLETLAGTLPGGRR